MTKIESLEELCKRFHETSWSNISVDSRRNVIEIQRNQIAQRANEIQELKLKLDYQLEVIDEQ